MRIDCDNLESECDAWLRDEWRGDEERMQWLVEEARSAVRDLRELRRVIKDAQVASIIFNDLQQVHDVDVFNEDDDGVPCKVIRMSKLEASDGD